MKHELKPMVLLLKNLLECIHQLSKLYRPFDQKKRRREFFETDVQYTIGMLIQLLDVKHKGMQIDNSC
jgi:hypothetical protein